MASNGVQDAQSNLLFLNLCSLLFTVLRDPPPRRISPAMPPLTPASFASLLFGASLSLMVCGSVTFVIGFILMPWFFLIMIALYFLGILSDVTAFWMETSGQFFSKRSINLDLRSVH